MFSSADLLRVSLLQPSTFSLLLLCLRLSMVPGVAVCSPVSKSDMTRTMTLPAGARMSPGWKVQRK